MKNPKDIYPVIHLSILGFGMPFYLIMGTVGYCLYGKQVLLTNENAVNLFAMLDKDFLPGQVAIFCIGLTLVSKIPLFFNPFRDIVRTSSRSLVEMVSGPESPWLNYLEDTLMVRLIISVIFATL